MIKTKTGIHPPQDSGFCFSFFYISISHFFYDFITKSSHFHFIVLLVKADKTFSKIFFFFICRYYKNRLSFFLIFYNIKKETRINLPPSLILVLFYEKILLITKAVLDVWPKDSSLAFYSISPISSFFFPPVHTVFAPAFLIPGPIPEKSSWFFPAPDFFLYTRSYAPYWPRDPLSTF